MNTEATAFMIIGVIALIASFTWLIWKGRG